DPQLGHADGARLPASRPPFDPESLEEGDQGQVLVERQGKVRLGSMPLEMAICRERAERRGRRPRVERQPPQPEWARDVAAAVVDEPVEDAAWPRSLATEKLFEEEQGLERSVPAEAPVHDLEVGSALL